MRIKPGPLLKILERPALDKAEVARLLNVGEPTVDNYIRLGNLRAIKLSARCIRILPADLERFLAERATRNERPEKEEVASVP
jgi:excisionase family DNA binding protein